MEVSVNKVYGPSSIPNVGHITAVGHHYNLHLVFLSGIFRPYEGRIIFTQYYVVNIFYFHWTRLESFILSKYVNIILLEFEFEFVYCFYLYALSCIVKINRYSKINPFRVINNKNNKNSKENQRHKSI